jgi:hypothetical protein
MLITLRVVRVILAQIEINVLPWADGLRLWPLFL